MKQHPTIGADIRPGWYLVPGREEVRWWSGQKWTPSTLRDGVSHAPLLIGTRQQAYFSIAFFALAAAQWALASATGGALIVSAILMTFIAVMYLASGLWGMAIERLPRPDSAVQIPPDSVRPMPGDAEAPGAGWYPLQQAQFARSMAGRTRVSRWWTGRRWAHYVSDGQQARPTFTDYRIANFVGISSIVCFALGVISGGVIVYLAMMQHADAIVFLSIPIVAAAVFVVLAIVLIPLYFQIKKQTDLTRLPAPYAVPTA